MLRSRFKTKLNEYISGKSITPKISLLRDLSKSIEEICKMLSAHDSKKENEVRNLESEMPNENGQ
ncbi:MAG: hypothetical protein O7D30_06485 [Rickettsia endosymbiont of Ixodes persulcatus]|nr:hypothetical protein [Rickettsia endosymbiont of Ixodes persulcatus]